MMHIILYHFIDNFLHCVIVISSELFVFFIEFIFVSFLDGWFLFRIYVETLHGGVVVGNWEFFELGEFGSVLFADLVEDGLGFVEIVCHLVEVMKEFTRR